MKKPRIAPGLLYFLAGSILRDWGKLDRQFAEIYLTFGLFDLRGFWAS
ncbi:hypothetical protein [Edaphobacter acidisoli]|nr:hypothetical protein [Edaphobacter acidisoli]